MTPKASKKPSPNSGSVIGDIKADAKKIDNKAYEKELSRLQIELVKMQEWIKHEKLKVVVIFEGRDAAGKGGVIKRITESLNPRLCRVVALGTPSDREKTSRYFQLYVYHLLLQEKWRCFTVAGTTVSAWNASWDFALMPNITSF